MKIITLMLFALLLLTCTANAQNLYTLANAANIANEVNATTGWSGPAALASVTDNPHDGTWSIRITTQSNGNRAASFNFDAVSGTTYNITIWGRRGTSNSNSAFKDWVNLTGFTETAISTTTWQLYSFTVTATSTTPTIRVYGSTSGPSGRTAFIDGITITAVAGDTQAPTAPTNLAASNTTATGTTLNWSASTDNVGVTQYQIRQNNTLIGSVAGNITTYNVTGLTASTTYSYNVVALDAANNVSPASNTVQVTTLSAGDTQAPTAPTNLAASNTTATGTTLNWSASTDNVGVTQYQIRQNNTLIGSVAGNITTYNVTGLTASTTYSYNVVALDAANNVSPASNTVQVTTLSGGSGTPYTSSNANLPTVNWQSNDLYVAGEIGVGTAPNSNYRLSVNGIIRNKELVVQSGWSDFVFEKDYQLATMKEIETFIIEHGHLKDIPSAAEIHENGVALSDINIRLLQKIEELTLYIIDADKRVKTLEQKDANVPQY
jgi:chitodextrinase